MYKQTHDNFVKFHLVTWFAKNWFVFHFQTQLGYLSDLSRNKVYLTKPMQSIKWQHFGPKWRTRRNNQKPNKDGRNNWEKLFFFKHSITNIYSESTSFCAKLINFMWNLFIYLNNNETRCSTPRLQVWFNNSWTNKLLQKKLPLWK